MDNDTGATEGQLIANGAGDFLANPAYPLFMGRQLGDWGSFAAPSPLYTEG